MKRHRPAREAFKSLFTVSLLPTPAGRTQTGGGHDEGLVTGNVPHGYESQDGRTDGKDARNREQGVLTQLGIPLKEVYRQNHLIAYEYQSIEIAQAYLSDAVLISEDSDYAQDGAHYLEDSRKSKALGHRHRYKGNGRSASGETDHRNEKHGYEQPCRNGQEKCLYSLYHNYYYYYIKGTQK